jgi:hypothetical protein
LAQIFRELVSSIVLAFSIVPRWFTVSELLNIEVAYARLTADGAVHPGRARDQRAGGHRTVRHPAKAPGDRPVGQQVRYLQPSGEGHRVGAGGDRIEIYRPLIADPKEMRKKRAEKAKEEGRADVVTGGPDVHRKRDDAGT